MTGRRADIVGGLEIRHRRTWSIILPDGEDLWELAQPTRARATAVRALLLAALPDWSKVTAQGWPDTVTADQRDAVGAVARMVRKVGDRQRRGVCLGCGCRQASCACGTDHRPDGPHYTPAELAWTR